MAVNFHSIAIKQECKLLQVRGASDTRSDDVIEFPVVQVDHLDQPGNDVVGTRSDVLDCDDVIATNQAAEHIDGLGFFQLGPAQDVGIEGGDADRLATCRGRQPICAV